MSVNMLQYLVFSCSPVKKIPIMLCVMTSGQLTAAAAEEGRCR